MYERYAMDKCITSWMTPWKDKSGGEPAQTQTPLRRGNNQNGTI